MSLQRWTTLIGNLQCRCGDNEVYNNKSAPVCTNPNICSNIQKLHPNLCSTPVQVMVQERTGVSITTDWLSYKLTMFMMPMLPILPYRHPLPASSWLVGQSLQWVFGKSVQWAPQVGWTAPLPQCWEASRPVLPVPAPLAQPKGRPRKQCKWVYIATYTWRSIQVKEIFSHTDIKRYRTLNNVK